MAVSIMLVLLVTSCRHNAPSLTGRQEIIVSAAVSLKDAFTEIAALSENRTGMTIRFNFGASGALQKQIESGAPADLFASAGSKQMDELATKDLIVPGSRADFARNVLVLVTPANDARMRSLMDLARSDVKKIAIGNPKTVPAGQYTEQTLTRLKLLPEIQAKLIYAEDVRQVLDYVVRGEVDAGLVYSSDAVNAGTTVKIVAPAPDDSHEPIVYPIAIVKDSHQQPAAKQFIDLVLSSEGQTILAKHGFTAIK